MEENLTIRPIISSGKFLFFIQLPILLSSQSWVPFRTVSRKILTELPIDWSGLPALGTSSELPIGQTGNFFLVAIHFLWNTKSATILEQRCVIIPEIQFPSDTNNNRVQFLSWIFDADFTHFCPNQGIN